MTSPASPPGDGVREGSGSGPVLAGILLVLLFILGGLPMYFVVVLTLGYSGGMAGMAWVLLIAYVVPLVGAIAMLVRASNRDHCPRSECGYGYSSLISLGGLLAVFVVTVGILA